MAGLSRENIDEQINRLKAEKEKKEKGENYSVADALKTERTSKINVNTNDYTQNEKKIEKATEANPFVRRITLDELINISRAKQGKPPVEPQKKTPFISRSKEIDTPSLNK